MGGPNAALADGWGSRLKKGAIQVKENMGTVAILDSIASALVGH